MQQQLLAFTKIVKCMESEERASAAAVKKGTQTIQDSLRCVINEPVWTMTFSIEAVRKAAQRQLKELKVPLHSATRPKRALHPECSRKNFAMHIQALDVTTRLHWPCWLLSCRGATPSLACISYRSM